LLRAIFELSITICYEIADLAQTFDFSKFLTERWGTPDALVEFLHAYGHRDIERTAVAQWFRRESVPSDKFAMLLGLLKIETGADVAVDRYLR
jgi:hypothetical protein